MSSEYEQWLGEVDRIIRETTGDASLSHDTVVRKGEYRESFDFGVEAKWMALAVLRQNGWKRDGEGGWVQGPMPQEKAGGYQPR